MYSRNKYDKKTSFGYSLPPGYDGSRFRRRRRGDNYGAEDEVILIPDSGFAHIDDTTTAEENGIGELSVSGVPTERGIREKRRFSASAENGSPDTHAFTNEPSPQPIATNDNTDDTSEAPCEETAGSHPKEKLSGILDKLGFNGTLSSDELLLCAVIFIIASDKGDGDRNVGDILLILALLLGIR